MTRLVFKENTNGEYSYTANVQGVVTYVIKYLRHSDEYELLVRANSIAMVVVGRFSTLAKAKAGAKAVETEYQRRIAGVTAN
jgi:hypothetical protein